MQGEESDYEEEDMDSSDLHVPSSDDSDSWGSDDEIPLPPSMKRSASIDEGVKNKTFQQETVDITVLSSHNQPGKRCYDKVAYCFICSKPQKKLSVHLKQHRENELVSEIIFLSPNQRREKFC